MKYKIGNGIFKEISTGSETRTIFMDKGAFSTDWLKKQEASYDEYENTHEGGNYDKKVLDYLDTLKHVIASKVLDLLGNQTVVNLLDIGCGTSKTKPVYIPDSPHINYIGLDPIPKNLEREYPFLCCRLEEVSEVLQDAKINIFLFCTSLDHFEDIKSIYDILSKSAARDSYAIFMSGLHDPSIIATEVGKNYLFNLHKGNFKKGALNKLKYFNRLRIFIAQMLKGYDSWAERDFKLKNKIPLDPYHFYYFQYSDYHEFMTTKMGKPEFETILDGRIIININKI